MRPDPKATRVANIISVVVSAATWAALALFVLFFVVGAVCAHDEDVYQGVAPVDVYPIP